MEITFQTPSGRRVVQDAVDCERVGDAYTVTTEDETNHTVEGFIVGLTTEWENVPYGTPRFKNAAIALSTEGRLDVPVKPLADGYTVDDDDWVYEDGFDFGVPEVGISDGECVLRNVSALMDERAACREAVDEADPFKLNAGDDGVVYNGSSDACASGLYQASFSSGWLSPTLRGTIERVSSYRESQKVERIAPTSATYETVAWAFE